MNLMDKKNKNSKTKDNNKKEDNNSNIYTITNADKYNWANWDIKEQPKIELEDIPEEPKKKRTATERQEEIDNIKAAMLRNRYWYDNYRAIDNLSPKIKLTINLKLNLMEDLDLI